MADSSTHSSLPQWPASSALRLRGRFPTAEASLGTPSVIYPANNAWSFTYRFPIRLGTEFSIRTPFDHTSPLVGVDAEGIYVLPNPDDLPRAVSLVNFVRDGDKLEMMRPSGRYVFGRRAMFSFPTEGKGIEVVAEVIDVPAAGPSDFDIPNFDPAWVASEDALLKAIAKDNVARAIASQTRLPDFAWRLLIPSPDPITRVLLVKNPTLPPRYISWAVGYPSALRENPMENILLATASGVVFSPELSGSYAPNPVNERETSFGSPLANASPAARARILTELGRR